LVGASERGPDQLAAPLGPDVVVAGVDPCRPDEIRVTVPTHYGGVPITG
jgi:hypothetical protein